MSSSISKSMILQIVGPAGAGKSFFARQFAKTFGVAAVDRDKIRWILFAHHTYSADEENIVSQVADLMTEELIKTRKSFILDGGYNSRSARSKLAALAKEHNYKILTITVQTDEATARARALKRDGRKPGDRYNQSLNPEQYAVELKKYQAPAPSGNLVVISGKHTYSTQARTVLKKIVELEGSAVPAAIRTVATTRRNGPFIQ